MAPYDRDERSALLQELLQRADAAMSTLNGDGNRVFGDFGCDNMVYFYTAYVVYESKVCAVNHAPV